MACTHKYIQNQRGQYFCEFCGDLKNPHQAAADARYREKNKGRGIVRKTVLVPEWRVRELQAILREWRAEANSGEQS